VYQTYTRSPPVKISAYDKEVVLLLVVMLPKVCPVQIEAMSLASLNPREVGFITSILSKEFS
jgi:hypothetical protein